jgi:hypothetical protein
VQEKGARLYKTQLLALMIERRSQLRFLTVRSNRACLHLVGTS